MASLQESILDDTDHDESAPSAKNMKKQSEDFNLLLQELKDKFNQSSTFYEKIQILTLIPVSLS